MDGSAGAVRPGAAPLVDSAVMRFPETGGTDGEAARTVGSVTRAPARADTVRRLQARADADTPEDAARARRFGARGIGLCRTEHMLLGRAPQAGRRTVGEAEQSVAGRT
ncbi:putative PEP-binding protein [Streptomyces sp. NPDC020731]|uniref:putative PEP-binding protein n=1 Tax=Streptomyces sp. NPDC020731 TaxID=3365085 RepID=UPI0037B11335